MDTQNLQENTENKETIFPKIKVNWGGLTINDGIRFGFGFGFGIIIWIIILLAISYVGLNALLSNFTQSFKLF